MSSYLRHSHVRQLRRAALTLILALGLVSTNLGAVPLAQAVEVQCGQASWYAMTSRTASGERADPNAYTAAHRTLPFGTMVRVTNLGNGRSVVVRINDRGPFTGGRIIDLTRRAANDLGFINAGTARVQISTADGDARIVC
ncbi:MAG: septal ring lytic transglycosylase RlpA family protein [Pseudomonadota bacterium]